MLPVVVALVCASMASAATVRPALDPGTNWSPLTRGFSPADAPFVCGRNGGLCYLPQDIQQAYDFPTGDGAPTGAGQTILIVTAYGAPYMEQLLQVFDFVLGIPDPPSFELYTQQTPVPGTQGSGATFHWQVETALDVEWAHSMAPGAKIVVAVARTDDTADVTQTIKEALPRYPGAIVSQSFGADESGPLSDPTLPATLGPIYFQALRNGGTVLAASGDFGASNGTELEGIPPSAMAAYPASDPLVLSVGGTMGYPGPDSLWRAPGGYGGEQVWNEIFNGMPGATGGAPSTIFDAPPWQRNLARTHDRLQPDVSYNAAANGGVLVAIACAPDPETGFLTLDPSTCNPFAPLTNAVGGTSAGAPQWSAIVALANELRLRSHRHPVGLVAPMLYDIGKDRRAYARDFHDITVGNNALNLAPFGGGPSAFGYSAAPGYDIPTGLGTPDVSNLIRDLAKGNNGDLPGGLFHGFKGIIKPKFKHHHFDPNR